MVTIGGVRRRGKKSPAYGHAKQPTGALAADKAKKEKWSPPGGCLARYAWSMRADFLENNHFTHEIF
jgi:hypothetical protein